MLLHSWQLIAVQRDDRYLVPRLHQSYGGLQHPVVPGEVIQYDVGYFHQRAFSLASKAACPRRTCAQ